MQASCLLSGSLGPFGGPASTRLNHPCHKTDIDGKKVLRGWESFSGWYWFATEKTSEQMSDLGDGRPVKDTIYFGLVQGLEEEWGYFSQAEIESLRLTTWEIPKKNLPYAGRRTT